MRYGNGSLIWQAESFCFAPAEHAATTRDRNEVRIARRDSKHPIPLEGLNAPWRMLIRYIAGPEQSKTFAAPSEELARFRHGTLA